MIRRPKPERFRLRRTMMFMNAQKPGLIKDAYIYGCDSIMLEEKTTEAPDAYALYEQAAVAPVSAVMDAQTKAVTPGSYGMGFDPEDAQALLERAVERACSGCSARRKCTQRETLTVDHILHPLEADCRKQGRLLPELRFAQEQLKNLKDGRLELSNNRAERSIKPFVIDRKNFL